MDWALCFILLGCAPDDYYQFSFPGKSWSERSTYLTHRRNAKLIKRYNPAELEHLLSKDSFDARFSNFIQRDWCALEGENGEARLAAFLAKHKKAFLKQKNGACGRGAFLLTEQDYLSRNYPHFDYNDYIAEECILQHHELAKLNPFAVNSIRVLTFHNVILQAGLKLGVGTSVVDNVHAGSIYGNIDIETGVTNAPFRNIALDSFTLHPSTGEALIGIQIPHWELLKSTVTKIAQELPEIPYVGWDVAVTEDGVAIIEGNSAPGQDGEITGVYHRIRAIEKHYRTDR